MFIITALGQSMIDQYLEDIQAKRKEILDAQKDTAENIHLPTKKEICEEADILFDGSPTIELMYGVTDHYDADYPLKLEENKDFILTEEEG